MDKISQIDKAESKVVAMACNVVDRRKVVRGAPKETKAREVGRYEKSLDELESAVDKFRARRSTDAQGSEP